MLLVGSVAAADVPELGEPETREEVRRRLGGAGCELVYSPASERWLARLDGAVPALEGHDPVLALGTAELAVLATCWLHLRFLPGEGGGDGRDWVDPDDLAELLGARLNGGLPGALERLAGAGYLTLREGRVEAGPLLDSLDEPGAADHARALLARHQRLAHLRQRAAELDGQQTDQGLSGGLEPSPPEEGGSQDDATA